MPVLSENQSIREPSSFRDPSGFVYRDSSGTLLRQVNEKGMEGYRAMMSGGLYDRLVSDGLMVSHQEVDLDRAYDDRARVVLQPEEVPFISYPSEWCFSQLKDAALLTLDVMKRALECQMILKDASAFNIQFVGAAPVFIDTLSFSPYQEGQKWDAYSQFCKHFLAPLALAAKKDIRLLGLLENQLDGVDLELATKLLPKRSLLSPRMLIHLHMNAWLERRFGESDKNENLVQKVKQKKISKTALTALVNDLKRAVEGLKYLPKGTEWADYYSDCSYSDDDFVAKKDCVSKFLAQVKPKIVWDLGANTGEFSQLAVDQGAFTYSMDLDYACVEKNYLRARKVGCQSMLPLIINLTRPTPAIGWNLRERKSLLDRGRCDAVLALALIHHLAIGKNIPLPLVADFLRPLTKYLIIEWVPKQDVQVQRLLRSREDIFDDYTLEGFLNAFQTDFDVLDQKQIHQHGRIVFLMWSRDGQAES